jgi:class 3 adenylate cyclase
VSAKASGEATFSVFAFLERTATQGERSVAVIRLIIAATVTLQFLFLRRGLEGLAAGSAKHWIILGGIASLCAFSAGIILLLKEHHVSHRLRLASVAVDVLATVLILAPSTIWAKESYVGFLTRPDPAIFVIVVVCAGFRLSTSGVWLASALTAAGCGLIFGLDFTLNGERLAYKPDSIVVFGLLVGASTLVGLSIRKKIVILVRDAAKAIIDGERARQRFGVYLSQELVDEALSADVLRPGGHRQSVAVLFSDLRGFTTYSEKLPPERLVEELNAYLEAMVTVIKAEGGVIDKYIGDAIMVVFGIPTERSDDATRALRCAIRMDEALVEHNRHRATLGQPALRHGVGVHYGDVVAGNLGTSERLQYTVVGDTVNLASRLESATKELGVALLFSQDLVDAVPEADRFAVLRGCGSITVKGREAPVEVLTASRVGTSADRQR